MESSTVLVFRIFVMLACLIVVPMAAIFGSAFPDVVKTVLIDRIMAWGTGKTNDSNKPSSAEFAEAPPAAWSNPSQGANSNWEAPRWGEQPAASPWQSQTANPSHPVAASGVIPAGAAGINPSSGNQAASFNAPADPGRAVASGASLERAPAEMAHPSQNAENGGGFKQPFGYPAASRSADSAVAPLHTSPPPEQPDRFTAMERRLREYGATYYLLETWGSEGDVYRFHCKMAIAGNSTSTRHFEATDSDALKAMARVLERVEAWRAGRLQ